MRPTEYRALRPCSGIAREDVCGAIIEGDWPDARLGERCAHHQGLTVGCNCNGTAEEVAHNDCIQHGRGLEVGLQLVRRAVAYEDVNGASVRRRVVFVLDG